MIRTRHITVSCDEIPSTWAFEYYLNLPEKLMGQDVKIKSVFNNKDTIPSLIIYLPRGSTSYKFKDFSSGYCGDKIDLVKYLYSLDFRHAKDKLITDYSAYLIDNKVADRHIAGHERYHVTDYNTRNWIQADAKYWTEYKISSKILEDYNVMPLQSYTMTCGEKIIMIQGTYLYGYFTSTGLLYKIYQPRNTAKKFIKVRPHIQGIDQLTYTKPNLIIMSSLKDLMTMVRMGFKTTEYIAPDCESALIPESVMWNLIERYDKIITLFDNDDAGRRGIARYTKAYAINGLYLDMEKDVSDSVKRYGLEIVKTRIAVDIVNTLKTNKRTPEQIILYNGGQRF
jgi:hypothetical protein